jgi:hypothetical protein
MFRAGDRYTKLVLPEAKLQPLVAWNTSTGSRCVLHGATIAAGDDDEDDKDAQWFTHFRIEVNGTTVMDVSRIVPDITRGQIASKMRVALDHKEIPAALPGVTSPEQHNSADSVVGLKLGTMGKRYIGMHRAERLVLNAGGVPMEITSAAARKFKSKRLQVKYAHFNLHIDKLPVGARGLIPELKGLQPLSNQSMSYLRQEQGLLFHADAGKQVQLRQRTRAEKRNEYEGLCPGQDALPPAPPFPPKNAIPLTDLESFTPLPKWCADTALTGNHDGGTPISPKSSNHGYDELVGNAQYCEQAPNDYTCRQCCDFGLSGPKSVCSSGNRCPGENNNEVWKASDGCGAAIGVTFMHEGEGTDTEICVEAAPVGAGCIKIFNVLEWGLQKEEQDKCLAMIDADSISDMSDKELAGFAAQYPQGLKNAILESRDALETEVENAAEGSDVHGLLPGNGATMNGGATMNSGATMSGGPKSGGMAVALDAAEDRKLKAVQKAMQKSDGTNHADLAIRLLAQGGTPVPDSVAKEEKIKALKRAMRVVDRDMHAHHAWQALVSLAKKRQKLPDDYKTDTLDVQVKSSFGQASLNDVKAVQKLLAKNLDEDEVKFCVNLEAVKFLIEEVAQLVDMCVKPSGYQCAPPSFCDSEACAGTPARVMLKACMESQTAKKRELAAFVQHGPGRNLTLTGCEAAEYALKAHSLPDNALAEDYVSMMRASSTIVKSEPIVKGLRSMLRARKSFQTNSHEEESGHKEDSSHKHKHQHAHK